ncbi:hypothetical protein D9M71_778910 [compost metagenome]
MYQNNQNRRAGKNNKTGIKGLSWHTKKRRWRGSISTNGVRVEVGTWVDFEDAKAAMQAARNEMHGDYAKQDVKDERQTEETQ